MVLEMPEKIIDEREITIQGNPGNPTGEAGKQMLQRMNQSHYEVTGWSFNFLDLNDGYKVLDIGCGGGMTLKRMSELSKDLCLYGLDHSLVAVKETMSLNENLIESDKLKVVEGSVDKLPYKNDFFDRAITVESFYFWPNPVENLKEVLRVLKPNGKFLLVADIYEKASLSQRARENIRMFKMLNPTPEEFVSMFKQAGFTKTEIKTKAQTDWIAVLGIK